MAIVRIRRKAGSYLPFALFLGAAWIATKLGNTLGQMLTIFAIVVWVIVALLAIYMVLIRDMRFTLWSESGEGVGELAVVPETVVIEDVEAGRSLVE